MPKLYWDITDQNVLTFQKWSLIACCGPHTAGHTRRRQMIDGSFEHQFSCAIWTNILSFMHTLLSYLSRDRLVYVSVQETIKENTWACSVSAASSTIITNNHINLFPPPPCPSSILSWRQRSAQTVSFRVCVSGNNTIGLNTYYKIIASL